MPRVKFTKLNVHRLRKDLNLSQHWMAHHLAVSPRTVRAWESRGEIPTHTVPRIQRLLRAVNDGRQLKGHGTYSQPGRPLKHPLYSDEA